MKKYITFTEVQLLIKKTAGKLSVLAMVFILYGCSFYYMHIWSKSGISFCWRHLVTSKESSNPIFFGKKLVFTIRAQHEMSNHLV